MATTHSITHLGDACPARRPHSIRAGVQFAVDHGNSIDPMGDAMDALDSIIRDRMECGASLNPIICKGCGQMSCRYLLKLAVCLVDLALAACGGGGGSTPAPAPPSTYSLNATVSGLNGTGLTVSINSGAAVTVGGNGTATLGSLTQAPRTRSPLSLPP